MALAGCAHRLPLEISEISEAHPIADSVRSYPTAALQRMFVAEVYRNNNDFARAIIEYQNALKYDTTSATIYGQLGETYVSLNYYSDAQDAYEKAVQLDPENHEYHRMLAQLYQVNQKPEASIFQWRETIRLAPDDAEAYFILADIYTGQNQLVQAADVLEKYLLIEKDNIPMYRKLVDLYRELNNFSKGITYLNRLLVLEPSDRYRYLLIQTYYDAGRTADADKEIKHWLETSEDNLDARLFLINVYMSNEQYDSARVHLTLAEDHWQENFWISVWQGELAEYDHRDADVRFYFQRAIDDTSSNSVPYQRYAFYLYNNKLMDEALSVLKSGLFRYPENLQLLWFTGTIYREQNQATRAIDYFERMSELNPGDRDVKHTLAMLYESTGNYGRSDDLYLELIQADSDDELALNNYSYSLAVRGIDLEKALEMSRKAIKLNPENGAYHDTMAWILYKMREYNNALKFLKIALQLESGNAELYFHFGEITLALGNSAEARVYYQKALELAPDYSDAKKRLEELP